MVIRKRFAFVSLLACVALTQFTIADDAPTSQPTIIPARDAEALKAALNTDVVVDGRISVAAWSNSGKVMNIDFEDAEQSRLLAVIFVRDREKFDAEFGGDAAKTLSGSHVQIKGKLQEYGGKSEHMKGRPQIVLSDPKQITMIDSATSQPAQ